MRVLVTGGSGFIGRELLKQLLKARHSVRAVVRSDASATVVRQLGAQPVRGDLTEPSALRALCEGVEVVVHLAAEVRDFGPLSRFYEVNVEGTRAMLEAARRAGARRFIHMSTVNDALARAELGYRPVITRDAGLAELFDWPAPRAPTARVEPAARSARPAQHAAR
jgi:nucleoside-diphosphate-sugar epimerase